MGYEYQSILNGSHVRKYAKQTHVPILWTPSFSSQRLDVAYGLTDFFATNGYSTNSLYGNDTTPMFLDITASYTNPDPHAAYVNLIQNYVPRGKPLSFHCHDGHFFSEGSSLYYPQNSIYVYNGGYVCNSDFNAMVNYDSVFSLGGYDRWFPDWDSESSRNMWVDRTLQHIINVYEIYRPYRRMTHVYMDNFQLNQQGPSPSFNFIHELDALNKLRSLLHRYLGVFVIGNFASFWCGISDDEIDLISNSVDGVTLEQWFHFILGRYKWYDPSHRIYQNIREVGILKTIDNSRRLANNGTTLIAIDSNQLTYSVIGASGYTHMYNPSNSYYAHVDTYVDDALYRKDLHARFDAAMAMIVRPDSSSNIFVGQAYNRLIGTYDSDGYVGSDPPGLNEWYSKDWLTWPSSFGNAVSDYSFDVIENGANAYNSATQSFVNVDAVEVSREFEGGTITVDITADLCDDLNVRRAAVNAVLT